MKRRDFVKAAAASVAAMAGVVTGRLSVGATVPEVKSAYWQVTSTYAHRDGMFYHVKYEVVPIPELDGVVAMTKERGKVNGEWKCLGHECRVVTEREPAKEWYEHRLVE